MYIIEPVGPEQVSSENPSVTYEYGTDEELLEATQEAAKFCGHYKGTVSQAGVVIKNEDGTDSVTFECAPVAESGLAAAPSDLPMTYTYRTPQELLQITQNAEEICKNYGKGATGTLTSNLNGTKTVTFECVP